MGTLRLWFAAVTLGVCAAAAQFQGGLTYQTTCQLVGKTSAKGYVQNASHDTYRVNGPVTFQFTSPGSPMPHGGVQVFADTVVPPGQSVLVAEAALTSAPADDDVCRFDVGSSIQKTGP